MSSCRAHQSRADLLLHHRLRPDRADAQSRRLRLHHPGHGRPDEHHRRERMSCPGGGPQKVGVAVADITTGMYSTVAILAALVHRSRTGEGQYIDMALLDAQVAMIANMNMNYLIGGRAPQAHGQRAREHRAVSGVRRVRRSIRGRGGQRRPVREILRGRGSGCSIRTHAFCATTIACAIVKCSCRCWRRC